MINSVLEFQLNASIYIRYTWRRNTQLDRVSIFLAFFRITSSFGFSPSEFENVLELTLRHRDPETTYYNRIEKKRNTLSFNLYQIIFELYPTLSSSVLISIKFDCAVYKNLWVLTINYTCVHNSLRHELNSVKMWLTSNTFFIRISIN